MNSEKIKAFCDHIEQEINWVSELNALLLNEKEMLATRQFHLLEEYAAKKQDLSDKLEHSAKNRMVLINKTDQSAAIALKDLLKECSQDLVDKVTALNKKLTEHLSTCRDLNAVNGQVIANNLYVRQEIIKTLSGNQDAMNVYNAHGNLQSNNNNKHHRKA